MATHFRSTMQRVGGIIKASGPLVREDFITKAVLAHFQGRLALTFVTTLVLLLIRGRCVGGWVITGLAWGWTVVSFISVCGARPHEKEEGVDMDFGSRLRFDYKQRSEYPWWTFIPDVLILTAMVVHSGAAFSLFIPMFLVLGTLGDHSLITWPWRRLFLPLFIFLPYTFVIIVSTQIGRDIMSTYLPWAAHETFWAPLESISYHAAICTWLIFVGATLLTSYVLRHLLIIGIGADFKRQANTGGNKLLPQSSLSDTRIKPKPRQDEANPKT
jgi:hypothetical protein